MLTCVIQAGGGEEGGLGFPGISLDREFLSEKRKSYGVT
jgi:hypothetical protein